jgi:CDGSH-type Zn-finger protein
VNVEPNGPLYIEGPFELYRDDGGPPIHHHDAALCRCGGSGDKPFCDGTHRSIGFAAE